MCFDYACLVLFTKDLVAMSVSLATVSCIVFFLEQVCMFRDARGEFKKSPMDKYIQATLLPITKALVHQLAVDFCLSHCGITLSGVLFHVNNAN